LVHGIETIDGYEIIVEESNRVVAVEFKKLILDRI
jgi:hypothetical protein